MLEKNEIIQSALRNLKIEELNPMQEASLEQATGRKDVILLSPTGSGKTLAYLLPLLLTLKPNDDSVQVLILVPSRELALQIDSVFKAMGTSWKTCCCYGGHPIAEEKKSILSNHPAIIIGTPGRITDHLSKGNFNPETIETLIIDEFDKSLEFGFHDEMAEIITQLPGLKKRMLLSATDAAEMAKFNANGHKFEAGMVKPVDQDGNYIIDSNDRIILGNKNPKWVLGWSNTFNYKGLELGIELNGRFGYMVDTGGEGQYGMYNQREISYWTPDNTGADYQKPIYSTAGGDAYSSLLGFKDASFIKIRNISLGYNFNSKALKNIGISSLKLYAQAKNIGNLYSSVDFMDLDLGTTYYNRGFTFGLQVGF